MAVFVAVAREGDEGACRALWEICGSMHFFTGAIGFHEETPTPLAPPSPTAGRQIGHGEWEVDLGPLEEGQPAQVRRAALSQRLEGEEDAALGVELFQLPVQVLTHVPHPALHRTQPRFLVQAAALRSAGFYSSLFELVVLWHAAMGSECMAYVDVLLTLPWRHHGLAAFCRMIQLTDELLPLSQLLSPHERPPVWLPRALQAATAMLRKVGDFTRWPREPPGGGAGGHGAPPAHRERFAEYLRIAVLVLRGASPAEAREVIHSLLREITIVVGLAPGEDEPGALAEGDPLARLSPRGVDGSLSPTAMAQSVALCREVVAVLDASPFLQRVDLTVALCQGLHAAPSLAVPMLVASGEGVGDPAAVTEIFETAIQVAVEEGVMWMTIQAALDWSTRHDFPQLCLNSGAILALAAWAWPVGEPTPTSQRAVGGVAATGISMGSTPVDLMAHCLSLPLRPEDGPKHVLLWCLVLLRGAHECPESLAWSSESLPHFVEAILGLVEEASQGYALGGLVGASGGLPVPLRLLMGFLYSFVAGQCRDRELQKLDLDAALPSLSECGGDGSKLAAARSLVVELVSGEHASLCSVGRYTMDVARLAYHDCTWLEAGLRELQANYEERHEA